MERNRRQFLAAVTGSFALAGCSGTDESSTATSTETRTDRPTTGEGDGSAGGTGDDGGSGPVVQVRDHADHGEILVDAEGMTLYMFDADTRGDRASSCYESCANAWPPLTVTGEPRVGESVSAELTTFERESGETQVAAAGWPLYYFASDEAPGDATGQGVNDVWWVLGHDGTPIRPDSTATETTTTGSDGTY